MTYFMVDAGKMVLLFFWVGFSVGLSLSLALRDLDRMFKEYNQRKRNERYYKIEQSFEEHNKKVEE